MIHALIFAAMNLRIIQTGTPEYEEMVGLRMKVLLDPIGIPRSYIDPEREKDDLLLVAEEDGKLIGCCVLTRVDGHSIQLRQMAVDNSLQGKGVGAAIVSFAEQTARHHGYRLLTMNARDVVLDFYRKCGYTVAGDQFFEVGIPHHRMEKRLEEEGKR
ncbi:MAG TPA: GNAT family N-acetyltransferase [Flavisolibacter sp.]|jgi:predicted GNAT family N-acyltransferase